MLLQVMDRKWREHLYEMDYLKEGIGLRAMAQRDPLIEYQREGFDMFTAMLDGIKEETVTLLFHVQVQVVPAEPVATGACRPGGGAGDRARRRAAPPARPRPASPPRATPAATGAEPDPEATAALPAVFRGATPTELCYSGPGRGRLHHAQCALGQRPPRAGPARRRRRRATSPAPAARGASTSSVTARRRRPALTPAPGHRLGAGSGQSDRMCAELAIMLAGARCARRIRRALSGQAQHVHTRPAAAPNRAASARTRPSIRHTAATSAASACGRHSRSRSTATPFLPACGQPPRASMPGSGDGWRAARAAFCRRTPRPRPQDGADRAPHAPRVQARAG